MLRAAVFVEAVEGSQNTLHRVKASRADQGRSQGTGQGTGQVMGQTHDTGQGRARCTGQKGYRAGLGIASMTQGNSW